MTPEPAERTAMSITETVITPDTPRAALDSRVRTAVLGAIRAEDGNWSIGSPLADRVMEALGPVLDEAEADRAKLAAFEERAEYWHRRWTQACERADQDGAQAISQHLRIQELKRRAEAAEAKLDELGRHLSTWFTHHGHNPSASFEVARALAEGQRQILDRDKSSSDEKEERHGLVDRIRQQVEPRHRVRRARDV